MTKEATAYVIELENPGGKPRYWGSGYWVEDRTRAWVYPSSDAALAQVKELSPGSSMYIIPVD